MKSVNEYYKNLDKTDALSTKFQLRAYYREICKKCKLPVASYAVSAIGAVRMNSPRPGRLHLTGHLVRDLVLVACCRLTARPSYLRWTPAHLEDCPPDHKYRCWTAILKI